MCIYGDDKKNVYLWKKTSGINRLFENLIKISLIVPVDFCIAEVFFRLTVGYKTLREPNEKNQIQS